MINKNKFLKNFISFFVFTVVVLFVYVILLTEIKSMVRTRVTKQEELNEKKNRIEMMQIEVQKLTAQERIIPIAQDTLGLDKPGLNIDSLTVDKKQLDYLINKINGKYGK
jgi:cell division protein FtsL